MGLPLWQPRVESDIPSRPEAKNPAHARSRIRGSSTRDRGSTAIRERPAWSVRHGEIRARERRRGLLQEMQARMVESNNNNPTAPAPLSPDAAAARRARNHNERQQELEDIMGRVRSAYAEAGPPPNETEGSEFVRHYGDARNNLVDQLDALRRLERETAGRPSVAPTASERFERASERFERDRASLRQARQQHEQSSTPFHTTERAQRLRAQAAIFARSVNESARENEAARSELGARGAGLSARVDGLGDRDRSLSPEGDNAWDTLLTTLTPDPQPPSAGSSFASIVSAVASRTTANESSNTSLTGRDTGAEESTFEQPCDSDDDGEPVDFEVDLGDETNATNQPSGALGSSYADVVRLGEYTMPGGTRTRNPPVRVRIPPYDGSRSGINTINASEPGSFNAIEPGSFSGGEPGTDDLILQLVGGLGGMQHIVRSLVRREDIPNDWWVDAGLSRALPRDDSSNNDSSTN